MMKMNDDQIISAIKNHEARIKALEAKFSKPISPKVLTKTSSLPDRILLLRDKGFFATSKTVEETHQMLQKDYACEPDRVGMALLRLADKKQLRKASKVVADSKRKAYAW